MRAVIRDDPQAWASEPLRRALDAVLYRWIALFGLPVVAALAHALNGGAEPLNSLVHVGLPAILIGFIGVHLVGLLWRDRGAPDGWRQAASADHATVVVTRSVGWVALMGAALAMIAPLGTLSDPRAFALEVLLWFPLLFPLYCLAVWITLECARHRLGRAAEESKRRFQEYWRDVARHGHSAA